MSDVIGRRRRHDAAQRSASAYVSLTNPTALPILNDERVKRAFLAGWDAAIAHVEREENKQ